MAFIYSKQNDDVPSIKRKLSKSMAMSVPAEAYSQPHQTSKMEIFCEVVNS